MDGDDVFLSSEFDPELIFYSDISPGPCDESLEEFGRYLTENDNELAKLILSNEDEKDEVKKKSKKEEKRERIIRLEGMIKDDRTIFEVKKRIVRENVLDKISSFTGPLNALAIAVQNGNRIEVRIRNLNNIDRVMRGIPVAFDKHWNMILKDVQDCWKPSHTQKGLYLTLNEVLPQFAKWDKPQPPLSHFRRRVLHSSFIKGDTVCLVRLLP